MRNEKIIADIPAQVYKYKIEENIIDKITCAEFWTSIISIINDNIKKLAELVKNSDMMFWLPKKRWHSMLTVCHHFSPLPNHPLKLHPFR